MTDMVRDGEGLDLSVEHQTLAAALKPLSRRGFFGVLGGVLLALLAALGLGTPALAMPQGGCAEYIGPCNSGTSCVVGRSPSGGRACECCISYLDTQCDAFGWPGSQAVLSCCDNGNEICDFDCCG